LNFIRLNANRITPLTAASRAINLNSEVER
jgi:hypothetical protein